MDLQQFDESPPSPSQQQQPDHHENSHGDHDAESIQENSNEKTTPDLTKILISTLKVIN